MWKFLGSHNYLLSKFMTSNVLMCIILLGTSVFTYGFETAVIATVQAMDHYEKQFGEFNSKTKKWELSAGRLAYLNSFPLITYGLGVVGASLISQRWGRRIVVGIMNIICIAGVLLSLLATNYGAALGGRLILYIHVGMEAVLVPMYLAEIVPAAIRGSVVATYAFSHMFAAFIASIITNFTSKIDSNLSWQLPIGLVLIFPVFVLLTITLLPESPRWLLRQERYQKAVDSLYYLHGARPEYSAEQEANLIMEAIRTATTQGKWSELLKGSNARRTWIGILCAAATQLTGQTFASNYGAVFLKQLNIMDPFTGTMIKRSLLVVACLFVIFFVEYTGRRRLALVSGSISATCLLIMGGLGTITKRNNDQSLTILAMTIMFPAFYTAGFGSNMQVVKSEIPHTSLRDKSIMVHWSAANICNFVATFTTPYLLKAPYANLGPKVGLIYGSISAVFIVLLFFFMPEMTNRSLEEVDEMMEARVPAWRTREWQATGLGSMLTRLGNGDRLEKGEEAGVEAHVTTTEVK